MQYLVDAGVLLRLFDQSDSEHMTILKLFTSLRREGQNLATCPQNIAEFWNVSTRPSLLAAVMGSLFCRRNVE